MWPLRDRLTSWETSLSSTGPTLPLLKVKFSGLAGCPASLLTSTGNEGTSGAQSLDFSWRFTSVSPSFSLHLFPPAGKSTWVCGLLLKLFWYVYLHVVVLCCFFFNSLCVIHIYFLIFYISLIQFCLSLWLVACWIAFCQKDSNEAAFFRLTDEEKSTFFETICFFSNEWIHRMDTRLLRSDKWWTGGISSTYLNAENSPEK